MNDLKYHEWIKFGDKGWICKECDKTTRDATKGSATKRNCPGRKKK